MLRRMLPLKKAGERTIGNNRPVSLTLVEALAPQYFRSIDDNRERLHFTHRRRATPHRTPHASAGLGHGDSFIGPLLVPQNA